MLRPRGPARTGIVAVLALVATLTPLGGDFPPADAASCEDTYVEGLVALPDLGSGTHHDAIGGLYAAGSNVAPVNHRDLGARLADSIEPLSSSGVPQAEGKIGFVSIGVSNTSAEFREFVNTPDPRRNPAVVLVNGAQGGKPVSAWTSPTASAWNVLADRVAGAGLTSQQVQAAWIKLPESSPTESFPADAETYVTQLSQVIRNLHASYPNIRVAYISSRIYGGYGEVLNPEPYAYQHGFGVKWTIEVQIEGSDLNADPLVGPVTAPWLSWGPYLWANGLGPDGVAGGTPGRADGLEWFCEDFQEDGIHPSPAGSAKVAAMLQAFLHSEPTACNWYLASPTTCGGAAAPDPPGFLDTVDSIFAADIEWLRQEGITLGCGPSVFCPDEFVTRGQMAAFLTRALGLPPGQDLFVDDDGHLFESEIQSIARAGITLGCGPSVFCPDEFVTRGQMAAFLHRSDGYFGD
jgi:hypothetical protein